MTIYSLEELALVYAHALDSNKPELLGGIFTLDAEFASPKRHLVGRDAIMSLPGLLASRYHCTMHFVGNRLIHHVLDDRAWGETYCLAHHLKGRSDGLWDNEVMAIRYRDEYLRTGGEWQFSSRNLQVDWLEKRVARALEARDTTTSDGDLEVPPSQLAEEGNAR